MIQLIACAGSVIGLIWALASGHGSKSPANSVTLAVMTTAGIAACMLFSGGILTAGSEIGDFAVRSGGGGGWGSVGAEPVELPKAYAVQIVWDSVAVEEFLLTEANK